MRKQSVCILRPVLLPYHPLVPALTTKYSLCSALNQCTVSSQKDQKLCNNAFLDILLDYTLSKIRIVVNGTIISFPLVQQIVSQPLYRCSIKLIDNVILTKIKTFSVQ